MRLEQEFLAALARVTTYELDDRTLTLLADDEAVVRLAC
jgi:heat shock protein HslJ